MKDIVLGLQILAIALSGWLIGYLMGYKDKEKEGKEPNKPDKPFTL